MAEFLIAGTDFGVDADKSRLELAAGHVTAAQEALRALAGVRAWQPPDSILIAAVHAAAGTPEELDTALDRLRLCVKLQPRSAGAHYQAGLLLLRKGDRGAAVRELRTAAQLDPDHAEARSGIRASALPYSIAASALA